MIRLLKNTAAGTWWHQYQNSVFLKRFTSVLGVDVLVKASGFLLIPFYLRLMSQEEYGLYNYLLSIIQTFALALNLGLYIPQTKLYHTLETKEERGSMLFTLGTTLLSFILLMSIPIFVFDLDYWIIRQFFNNQFSYAPYRPMVLLALLVTILGFMLTYYLFTSEKIKQIKAYNIGRVFYLVITLGALYLLKGDAVQVRLTVTYVAELVLLCIFGYYFVKEAVPVFSRKLMATCLKMGVPIMISALFGLILNFTDKFFLEKYGSLKDLSSYYLAFSFASIIPIIFAPLQNVWMPLFMKEKDMQKNVDKTKALISKLLLFFFILAVGIWCLFQLLLWTHTIPEKYSDVAWVLPILLATQMLMAISSLLGNYLVYYEKTHLVSIAGLLASVTGFLLSMWLIPAWGMYGAALTALTGNLLYLGVNYYLVQLCKNRYHAVVSEGSTPKARGQAMDHTRNSVPTTDNKETYL